MAVLAIIPAIRRTIENDFRLSRMQVTGNGVIREACNEIYVPKAGRPDPDFGCGAGESIFLSYP
jgi:hypothetical protein